MTAGSFKKGIIANALDSTEYCAHYVRVIATRKTATEPATRTMLSEPEQVRG